MLSLHPGPDRDFAFPNPPKPSAAVRLAEAERRLLETMIERFADRDGHTGDLARLIIVLRAEVRTQSPTGEAIEHG
ncbi:hypothetical protein [Sphingomonas abietis]|uniref:MarR family transcriptional regulator n=1 Tax=Sphingomonas abietis TaxID=3012344 RepID=A0ABY7NSM9_9SPHN|nr:hypothetical protein [Sphingomonas abietis]WBO23960.1 hypothetical protein PBT88_07575 [Sphingomonas abietis]